MIRLGVANTNCWDAWKHGSHGSHDVRMRQSMRRSWKWSCWSPGNCDGLIRMTYLSSNSKIHDSVITWGLEDKFQKDTGSRIWIITNYNPGISGHFGVYSHIHRHVVIDPPSPSNKLLALFERSEHVAPLRRSHRLSLKQRQSTRQAFWVCSPDRDGGVNWCDKNTQRLLNVCIKNANYETWGSKIINWITQIWESNDNQASSFIHRNCELGNTTTLWLWSQPISAIAMPVGMGFARIQRQFMYIWEFGNPITLILNTYCMVPILWKSSTKPWSSRRIILGWRA